MGEEFGVEIELVEVGVVWGDDEDVVYGGDDGGGCVGMWE